MYVLVSPIIAHDFWNDLNEISAKGVRLSPAVTQEICAALVAGDYKQCRRIRVKNPVPFQSGPGNTVAIRDGANEHLIDGEDKAWVKLDYYIAFVNRTGRER